jgi:UDP-N-acetylmuramoyl-L-alanyl-D-glutamate--2,6-diaminopimelate ligase
MAEGLTVAEVARHVDGRVVGDGGTVVLGASHDSRDVRAGDLFCCVMGHQRDGHDFAADALGAGAVALLVERELELAAPQIVVGSVRLAMGPAASVIHHDPSRELRVVGVTGTNGKTTTVTLVGHVLSRLGHRVEVIGTLTGARTTPEATDLQRRFRAAVDSGVTHVVMEVSSHALDLGRVDGTRFAVTAFTNLGVDHLDYHGTPERYFAAKARLFEPDRTPVAVVNVDDVHGRLLASTLESTPVTVVAVRRSDATEVRTGPKGMSLRWRGEAVRSPLVGGHNLDNLLCAAEICHALGATPSEIAAALVDAGPPPGRMELVDAGQPFAVIVDYAHTPDALEAVLGAAREIGSDRVIVVFGCGGDRDTQKRPAMGRVAAALADVVVLTSDNPRSEDPSTIMEQVRSGIDGSDGRAEVRDEVDRRLAIRTALELARPGDVVVIAGKGHETTQEIAGETVPFDDRQVAVEVWAELVASGGGHR